MKYFSGGIVSSESPTDWFWEKRSCTWTSAFTTPARRFHSISTYCYTRTSNARTSEGTVIGNLSLGKLMGKKSRFSYGYQALFFGRLGSNSIPILGLTQDQKFSNSVDNSLTQNTGAKKRWKIVRQLPKVGNFDLFSTKMSQILAWKAFNSGLKL